MSVCSLVLNFLHGCTQYSVLQTYNEVSFAQKYIYSVYCYMENLYNSSLLHQKPRLPVQMTFSWFFFFWFFFICIFTQICSFSSGFKKRPKYIDCHLSAIVLGLTCQRGLILHFMLYLGFARIFLWLSIPPLYFVYMHQGEGQKQYKIMQSVLTQRRSLYTFLRSNYLGPK